MSKLVWRRDRVRIAVPGEDRLVDIEEDPGKVERGGFGVDVPEPCCITSAQTRGAQHHVTCEEY
jgi:hypothetical protein